MDSTLYAPLVPTQPIPESPRTHWGTFPGSRRPANKLAAGGPPAPDKVLLKTGGNALQAVPREAIAHDENRLMAVSVPVGLNPGDRIRIAVPDDSGRLVEAVVPNGAFEGHTFLVRIPDEDVFAAAAEAPCSANVASLVPYGGGDIPEATAQPAPTFPPFRVVPGHDADLRLAHVLETPPLPAPNATNYSSPANRQPFSAALSAPAHPSSTASPPERHVDVGHGGGDELVLVQVPPGAMPGSAIRVQLDDGRLLEATIPEDNVKEFFLRVPNSVATRPPAQQQQQNWHDHPLALCPMALP